jgi:hypothetical protein
MMLQIIISQIYQNVNAFLDTYLLESLLEVRCQFCCLTNTTWLGLQMQPEVVEKLVALREGIPRKDAKEVCNLANSSDPSMVDGPEVNIRYY